MPRPSADREVEARERARHASPLRTWYGGMRKSKLSGTPRSLWLVLAARGTTTTSQGRRMRRPCADREFASRHEVEAREKSRRERGARHASPLRIWYGGMRKSKLSGNAAIDKVSTRRARHHNNFAGATHASPPCADKNWHRDTGEACLAPTKRTWTAVQ
jgi:hypothetical protein